MEKRVHLMAPACRDASQRDLDTRLCALTNLGAPIDDIQVHPDRQSLASSSVLAKRRIEWGFKTPGAYVGTDECPKAQFRHCLRRRRYDAKVNSYVQPCDNRRDQ